MIILINGPINSGKTTISKILTEKISKTALVEVDSLREMIRWMPIGEAIPINLKNTISVVKNFVSEGLNVVVPYPLSKDNYEYMISNLADLKIKIHTFTLAPRLDKALSNRGSREITDAEKDRIKYHYEIGISSPSFGEIIDNSDLTPEVTADIILNKIKNEL